MRSGRLALAMSLRIAAAFLGLTLVVASEPETPGEEPGTGELPGLGDESADEINPLFDADNDLMTEEDLNHLLDRLLGDEVPGEASGLPSGQDSLEDARLIALARKVVRSLVVVRAYDEQGIELGRAGGFFADREGLIVTDTTVLGTTDDGSPAYLTVVTASGENYRVDRIRGRDLSRGSLFLHAEGVVDSPPLPLATRPLVGDEANEVAVLAFNDERGLVLADAVARPQPSADDTPWMVVDGRDSAGIAGSPVIDRQGRVLGTVSLTFELGQWRSYALPAADLPPSIASAATREGVPVDQAADFREPPAKEESRLLRAVQALQDGRPVRALRTLALAVRENPSSAGAWTLYGVAARRVGAPTEAKAALERAAALQPDAGSIWYQLALTEVKRLLGEEEAASVEEMRSLAGKLQKATERGQDGSVAWQLMGEAALRAGEYEEAVRAFLAVTAEEPRYPSGYFYLGLAQAKRGRLVEAQEALGRCLALKGDHDRAWFLLGLVYEEVGNREDAIACLENAVRHEPTSAKAWRALTDTYLKAGNRQKARQCHLRWMEARRGG